MQDRHLALTEQSDQMANIGKMCYLCGFKVMCNNHFAIALQLLTSSGHEYDYYKETLLSTRERQHCFVCLCAPTLDGLRFGIQLRSSDHPASSPFFSHISFKLGLHSCKQSNYAKGSLSKVPDENPCM